MVALVTAGQMLHACKGVTEGGFERGKAAIGRENVDEGGPTPYGSIDRQGGAVGEANVGMDESRPLLATKAGDIGDKKSSADKLRRILRDPKVYALIGWCFFYVRRTNSLFAIRG